MEKSKKIGEILRTLCERKGVEIIEATACKDQIHILVSITAKDKRIGICGIFERKKQLNDI